MELKIRQSNAKEIWNEQKTNRIDDLDGYGLRDKTEGNAVALANTPVMDKLMAECPFVKGNASGLCCRSSGWTDG